MFLIVVQIICLASFLGIALFVYRKIPVLLTLPKEAPLEQTSGIDTTSKKANPFSLFKSSSFDIFLQKILSKIRILVLKTESKIAGWLEGLRKKAQSKKVYENDNYWQEVSSPEKEAPKPALSESEVPPGGSPANDDSPGTKAKLTAFGNRIRKSTLAGKIRKVRIRKPKSGSSVASA